MLINSFLTYLRCELNRSAHTVLSYHTDILQFARFITGGHPEQFRPELTETADIRSWTLRLAQSGVSLRSIRRKVSSLSALFRYLMQRGLMAHNPAREIPLARPHADLPTFIRQDEMQQIIESHLDTLRRPSDAGASPTENSTDTVDSFTDTRNALILLMFYSTGLRLSELIGLMDADVDTARGELKVLGKRNKERLIPFGTELADAIGAYRLRRMRSAALASLLRLAPFQAVRLRLTLRQLFEKSWTKNFYLSPPSPSAGRLPAVPRKPRRLKAACVN